MNIFYKKKICKLKFVEKMRKMGTGLFVSKWLLHKNNIKGLILDVDNTLINLDRKMPTGVSSWAKDLKANGIKICILSNSNHLDKVEAVAKIIEVPYIFFGKKPLKSGFLKVQKELGYKPEQIGVVGDQIFTDIVGGNRCNMFTILIDAIDDKDFWYTLWKRPLEKMLKKKFKEKGL